MCTLTSPLHHSPAPPTVLLLCTCARCAVECLGTGVLVFSIGFAAIESELTQEGVIRSAHSRRTQDTPALDARRLGVWLTHWPGSVYCVSCVALRVVDQVGGALAAGLTLVFLVYMLGNSSGAHLNPCATLASTLRGAFPPMWLPFYCLAQFTGAVVASAVLRALYGATAQFATPAVNAAYSDAKGMGVEAVATFILITTFLAMIQRGGNIGRTTDHQPTASRPHVRLLRRLLTPGVRVCVALSC